MGRLRLLCRLAAGAALMCGWPVMGAAQVADSWVARWQARATATQSEQPHWATPLATSTPRIDQAMRGEFVRQTNTARYGTWNLGNSKGLELIPERHTELVFGVPPFFEHAQRG